MSFGVFDREGREISFDEYVGLIESRRQGGEDYRRVEWTEVDNGFVSTVWLGVDHRFGDEGPPLIFETMIHVRGSWLEWQARYSSEEEARAGHRRALLWLAAGMPEDGWEWSP